MSPNPYQFIGFVAMDATRPSKFIRFGVMDVTKPLSIYMLWWMLPNLINLYGLGPGMSPNPMNLYGLGAMDVTKSHSIYGLCGRGWHQTL